MAQQIFTWDASGTTLHIPALPQGLQGLAFVILLSLLFLLLHRRLKTKSTSREIAGQAATGWRKFSGILKTIYLPFLLLIGTGGILWVLYEYVFQIPPLISGILTQLKGQVGVGNPESLRNLATAFAALAGSLAFLATIPFQLVRVWINERTARTAEENLTTALINKAVEGLGAEKTVKGRIGSKAFERTKPNIEVRVGAIYALERIAQDSDRDHVRIMEILCAYIRENAPARDAKTHGLGEWEPLKADATDEERSAFAKAFVDRFGAPFGEEGKLQMWASGLEKPPTDICAAIEVIGRRSDWQTDLEKKARGRGDASGYRLDLRNTKLQAADLSHLNLKGADFTWAHLEGADLGGAHLEGANLGWAHLEGADLGWAHLEGADLGRAHLEGADLWDAHLEGANLGGAHLEGADLGGAQFDVDTDFSAATLRGAALKSVILTMPDVNLDLLTEAFGDVTVTLPEGWKAGEGKLGHWSTEDLGWEEFYAAWRKHQADIGYLPPSP